MKKRIGSVLLTLAMVLALFPAAAVPVRAEAATGSFDDLQNLLTNGATVKLEKDYVAQSGESRIIITADTTVTIDLNGHKIDRALTGAASNGNVINVAGTLTINDTAGGGTITGGWNSDEGGGVRVLSGGVFNMTGGSISNNTAKSSGGGIYMAGGTVSLSGSAKISNNKVSGGTSNQYGGGVYMYGGTFNLSGSAEISNNIIDNESSDGGHCGGGVYQYMGTFNMSGGSITGNYARGNDNGSGGGVFLNNNSSCNFNLTGGTISGNTAGYRGGGIFAKGNSVIKISGNPVVRGNTAEAGTANLFLDGNKTITIDDKLTDGASIGVTLLNGSGVFTSGYKSKSNTTDPDTYFFADNGKVIDWNSGRQEAELTTNDAHTHTDANGNTVTFKAWPSTNSLPDTAGNYYLTGDVTLSATWNVPSGTTNLCLNGKSITLTADTGSVISISSGRGLNLYDESSATDEHTIADPTGGEVVTITGGVITGGKGYDSGTKGGGVYIAAGGTFHMYGGTIAGNQVINGSNATDGGGGVYVAGAFVMDGGTVCHNKMSGTSSYGGGVAVVSKGSFTMNTGAVVENNRSENGGGGVSAYGTNSQVPKIVMNSGAVIRNNEANVSSSSGYGGGVQISYGSIEMADVTITGNSAYSGGGVVISQGSSFTMSGGAITGNTATNRGSGVYFMNGTMTVSGSAQITDNANNSTVGNVFFNGDTPKISVGDSGLTAGASIGVKTSRTPGSVSYANPYPVTTNGSAYNDYFHSDDSSYEVEATSDGKVGLAYYRTATFNMNGHGNNVTQKVYNGDTVTKPTDPTAAGYTFGGWYTDTNCTTEYDFSTTVSGSKTLYAKWTPVAATLPSVTATNVTMTYGDSGKSVSVTATPAEGHEITGYQWYSNATNSNTGGTPISGATNSAYALTGMNAGTYYYYCVVTVKRADNNQTTTATSNAATVTVNRKDISLENCSYHFPTLIYDGTEKTIHFETLQIGNDNVTEGVDYTLSGNTIGKDAGTYTGLTFTGIGNYTGTRSFTLGWTISKREVTLEWSNTSFTYDGTEKCPTATVSNLVDGDTCAVTVTGAQTSAGTYTAEATELGNPNYRLPSTTSYPNANSKSFTIGQKEAALSWDQLNFTYDGTEKCPAATVSNLESGDTCTVTVTGGITNAGSGTATATALSNLNYKLPSADHISFSVVKASQAAPTNAPTAASTTANSITLTATDGYEYKLGDEAWQTSNVFTGLDMNAEYTFYQRVAGDANHNPSDTSPAASISTANHVHSWSYSASGAVLTATCADTDGGHGVTKTATLTISATGKTYDGTAVTASVTGCIDGVTTPDIIYKQGNTALDEAPKDAGTYTANITLGAATASVEFTINKAALTVTADNKGITYGDPAPAYSVSYSGWVNSEDTSALTTAPTATSAYTQYNGVNTYAIAPNGGAATNYSFNYVDGTLTVGKKDITISGITAADKTYDGNTGADLDYTSVTYSGVVNGDELTVTATGTFDNKNTGTGKTVTIRDLSLGGAKAGNYQLAATGQQTGTTANITAKAVTVSGITAESKVYDGGTAATLKYGGVTFSGKIDGDTLTATATGTFDSAAKGTGKTVTITGLTLTGASASNYILAVEGQQTTTTANITGAATSVTTIPTASAIIYGQTLADSSLTGGVGSVAGTFSWAVPSTAPAVSDSGVTEYDVTFTPDDEENYAPSTCKVRLTVSKATPTIATNPTASEIGYGQTLAASTLTGGTAENPYNHAAVEGTFAWTDTTTAPAKTDSNSTPYSVTFTPTDTANYNNATTTITLTVNKAALSPAPTVTMSGYTYGSTPSTPSVSNNPESTTVTYYYSKISYLSGTPTADTGTVWTEVDGETLAAGTYFMRAVLAESANYAQYVTAQTTFTVSQAQYAAPTAPTVSGYTVTIAEADRNKRLEYAVVTSGSAAPATYAPVPTLSVGGTFTLSGLAKETNYTVYLRERASANGNYKASDAINTSWTTPTEWTVVYNANRGTGTVPATQNGTGTTAVTVASGSGLTRTGYAFSEWNTKADGGGTSYAAGASISDGATLYAQWTANSYKVKFNANGGTNTMTDEDFTYDTAQALTANAFTRDGYTFAGWSTSAGGPVLYGNGQSVKNLAVSGSVTLYAVWTQNTYAVSGSVSSETNSTVTVKLMQGNAQFAAQDITISGGSGSYSFTGVPAGTYNLVATQGDQTVTEIIVITDAGVTRNITMPSYKVSSVLEVKGEDTPPVVVGGLNNEATSKAEESKTVTITMTVEKQEAQQLPETATEAEQETQDAIEAIESAASSSDGVEYMNITVQKEVKNSGGTTESTETLTTTNTVMEIVIPYDMDGKKNIKVYRHHDGAAAPLAQTGTKADGTYHVDTENGLIYLYANQFSTYAIAYEEVGSDPVTPPTPPTPPSPSGGGTSYYTITVVGTEGGTVTASRKTASRGTTVTLTVTADTDFQLTSLTVTNGAGKNISLTRAGDKYTFSMPSSKVTVTETFAPKSCAQDDTCPISAFTDADPTAWYHDGVHYVLENGIMSGYGGAETGSFGPNDKTSRAMMAQILWNMEGKPVVNYLLTYSDVAEGMWYTEAVRWVTAEGIMNGYGDGLFGPHDAMTREQLVTIVHRYAIYKGVDVSVGEDTNILSYDDAFDVSEWAIPAMQWAVGSGAVGGRTDRTLNPKDTATRAEIATIMMRYSIEISK